MGFGQHGFKISIFQRNICISNLMKTRFCYGGKILGEKWKKIYPARQHKFVLTVASRADPVVLKNLCSACGIYMCLAHYVSPLMGSLTEKLRGNFSGILFCIQTVTFSLKNQNTMNLMWVREYYSFCFQTVRMTLNSNL